MLSYALAGFLVLLVMRMIAEMAIRVEATRLLYQKAAWNLDNGVRDPIVSSYAKAYGADSAMTTDRTGRRAAGKWPGEAVMPPP